MNLKNIDDGLRLEFDKTDRLFSASGRIDLKRIKSTLRGDSIERNQPERILNLSDNQNESGAYVLAADEFIVDSSVKKVNENPDLDVSSRVGMDLSDNDVNIDDLMNVPYEDEHEFEQPLDS